MTDTSLAAFPLQYSVCLPNRILKVKISLSWGLFNFRLKQGQDCDIKPPVQVYISPKPLLSEALCSHFTFSGNTGVNLSLCHSLGSSLLLSRGHCLTSTTCWVHSALAGMWGSPCSPANIHTKGPFCHLHAASFLWNTPRLQRCAKVPNRVTFKITGTGIKPVAIHWNINFSGFWSLFIKIQFWFSSTRKEFLKISPK